MIFCLEQYFLRGYVPEAIIAPDLSKITDSKIEYFRPG